MATTDNAPRSRKRIEATVLKHARDGSAFTRCEACNKDVAIILIDLHSYSLDSKICLSLGSIFQRLEVNGRHKPTREYIDRECNGVKPPNNFGEVDPWTAWAYIPRTILLLLMGTCFLIWASGALFRKEGSLLNVSHL